MTSLPATSDYSSGSLADNASLMDVMGKDAFGCAIDENSDNYDDVGICDPSPNDYKPRIILMGMKRSGKSSIQKVVFQKMSPNETLFLESTTKVTREEISSSSFIQFQVWEYPGQMNAFDPAIDPYADFGGCGAVIFVIDAQDDYSYALQKLLDLVTKAYQINSQIKFEVFIHKVDGLSDDQKIEAQRDIYQRVNDDLIDANFDNVHLSFYLTSIYDHSIFEAFSKVVQKLIPQLPVLENLLNIFISNSGIEKAFLFDVASKIYVATDSSPVDMQSYELCCDMIDVMIDISFIYGLKEDSERRGGDLKSTAVIRLNNNTILYLKEVNRYLAMVCVLRADSFAKRGLINYNFNCFKRAIEQVFLQRARTMRSLGSKADQLLQLHSEQDVQEEEEEEEEEEHANRSYSTASPNVIPF
ncbi:hypothetical protein M514_12279 [Trichuris suis]|uniref:Gtr1/RagA G protein region n=1 Tax=Trichuris suis TaxID=68888 RepID=A0A085N6A0_9BILA|nr:hypothetical protein M514_12279 [Trichuris suis]